MPAQTLFKMAQQAAIRLADQIRDISHMPYDIARAFLLKIENPQQIRDLEVNCPHLLEHTEELWRRFIARDIPDWQNKIVSPKNPNKWHKVYIHLQRKEQREAEAAEAALRADVQGAGAKKAMSQTLVVDQTLPFPREKDEPTKFIDGVARKDLLDRQKQPSLKNAKNGRDAMAAIRRQAAMASSQKSQATSMRGPDKAQQLASAKRQITQAPQSMVNAIIRPPQQLTIAPRDLHPHEKEMLAEVKRTRALNRNIIGPAPGRLADAQFAEKHRKTVEAARAKSLAEKEAKLRAITEKQKSTPTKQQKEFDFAPSPNIIDPAKRSSVSPQPKRKRLDSDDETAVAQSTEEEHKAFDEKALDDFLFKPSASPEAKSPAPPPPPPVAQKRKANVFMPSRNKRRRV